MPHISSSRRVALAVAVWLLVVTTGTVALGWYKVMPGAAGVAAAQFPPESALRPAPGRATLLVFAHPRCPCTRATLSELARLLTAAQGPVEAAVLFTVPPGETESWARTDTWAAAEAIPGVRVLPDADGREGRLFGALTSGWTVLYGADGALVFSGGLTASRGHEGDNEGRDRVLAHLARRDTSHGSTPVFGCELGDDGWK